MRLWDIRKLGMGSAIKGGAVRAVTSPTAGKRKSADLGAELCVDQYKHSRVVTSAYFSPV